jgi:GTPase SAR1 family protein
MSLFKLYRTEKDDDVRKSFLNPNFLVPPFRIIVCGASGSGKTNLIKNIIFNKQLGFKDYFDNIFLFIGSGDDYREYSKLALKTKSRVYNHKKKEYYKSIKEDLTEKLQIEQRTTEAELQEIYNELEENDYEKESSLIIFDDMITEKILSNNFKMTIIDKLFVQGRHVGMGISTIISTQKLRALKQNLRTTNSTHLILFFGISKIDLEVVAKENSAWMTPDDFKKIYTEHCDKKYRFIIVYQKNPKGIYIQNDKLEFIA